MREKNYDRLLSAGGSQKKRAEKIDCMAKILDPAPCQEIILCCRRRNSQPCTSFYRRTDWSC